MFIDHSSNIITKYEAFYGTTHYRAFGNFIGKTLIEKFKSVSYKKDDQYFVLAPKVYINKKLVNTVNILTGWAILPYTWKSDNLPTILLNVNSMVDMELIFNNLDSNIVNINTSLENKKNIALNSTVGSTEHVTAITDLAEQIKNTESSLKAVASSTKVNRKQSGIGFGVTPAHASTIKDISKTNRKYSTISGNPPTEAPITSPKELVTSVKSNPKGEWT